MTKRALLPGEQEAWERACAERRWVVRSDGYWWIAVDGLYSRDSTRADMVARAEADRRTFSGDVIAYRARSVRADGTPVVP